MYLYFAISLLPVNYAEPFGWKLPKLYSDPDKDRYIPFTNIKLPVRNKPDEKKEDKPSLKERFVNKAKNIWNKLLGREKPEIAKPPKVPETPKVPVAPTIPTGPEDGLDNDELTPDSPSKDTDDKMEDGTLPQESLEEESEFADEVESKPVVNLPKGHPCCIKKNKK